MIQADLTADSDVSAAAERIAGEQRLALLVNNAGFGTKGRFWEAPLETQENIHRLHVLATVRLTHAALGNLVPRDFGGIINVASVAAWVRTPGSTSYSATKSWMTAFTEGPLSRIAQRSVECHRPGIVPGFTYSEFHDKMPVDRKRLAGPPSG